MHGSVILWLEKSAKSREYISAELFVSCPLISHYWLSTYLPSIANEWWLQHPGCLTPRLSILPSSYLHFGRISARLHPLEEKLFVGCLLSFLLSQIRCHFLIARDGEVPSQKELSSYFEELFSGKVPCQKELSSSNEELFPNPVDCHVQKRSEYSHDTVIS